MLGLEVGAASDQPSASQRYQGQKAHQAGALRSLLRLLGACAAGLGAVVAFLRLILLLVQVAIDKRRYDYFDMANGRPAAIAAPRYRHFPFLLLVVVDV